MATPRLVAQMKDPRDATACLRLLAYQAQESVYVIVVAGACKVASVTINADWIPQVPDKFSLTGSLALFYFKWKVVPNDVHQIMLRIYMSFLSPSGSATIGTYATRSQNTTAKQYR